jgi:hypothetical protein
MEEDEEKEDDLWFLEPNFKMRQACVSHFRRSSATFFFDATQITELSFMFYAFPIEKHPNFRHFLCLSLRTHISHSRKNPRRAEKTISVFLIPPSMFILPVQAFSWKFCNIIRRSAQLFMLL